MENIQVEIDMDLYDQAFSKWVIDTYGKAFDAPDIFKKFDSSLGLKHSNMNETGTQYGFVVTNEKRFFLAKIKYGF